MATNFMTPVVLRSKPLALKGLHDAIEPLPWFLEVALIAAICGPWDTLRPSRPRRDEHSWH
jgi:hypothetical protein